MPYQRIKWLILVIPTVTLALWEYVRHAFLLPVISMDLGNVLAPVLVFLITMTLVRKLFRMMENVTDTLHQEQTAKAAFMEREQLARELHDGISQSLFLLSVKLDKLEKAQDHGDIRTTTDEIRSTVRHVYEDVRQSIASLQSEPAKTEVQWMQSVQRMAEELELGGLKVVMDWQLRDSHLTSKEKVELLAIVRESMLNVQKHANAERLTVRAVPQPSGSGFVCTVADDGIGADEAELLAKGRYGIRMMQGRARAMGWRLDIRRIAASGGPNAGDGMIVEIVKGA
ncbi:sensor histidine kinase [Paenibacillus oenotherae]|uniref:histidine kinase n=1 Tax=Paenibacillus oenotherae TaxID=1435645 RepID=A0ABS7D3Q5_9BACL|nr:histidine kinase [Paenibacillus oenotherae]MBW7474446.1 sensor histidine kinase [Paenibacillus oenotherae]